jgi:ribosome-associated translation inhibitor RaiA
MKVQVDHDDHVRSSATRRAEIEAMVTSSLDRFGASVTLVQVHLTDENGPRFGAEDKRCLMEARVRRHDPVVVSHRANSVQQAISGATTKLERSLTQVLERQRQR